MILLATSVPFIIGFLIIFLGYICQSTLLSFWFYFLKRKDYINWKIQSQTNDIIPVTFYWMPIFSTKAFRGPYHRVITTFNLIVASCFAGSLIHICYIETLNPFNFESLELYGVRKLIRDLFVAVLYEHIVEYYWHRLMHLKYFYATFHKHHHFYKAPEVWDDMYIHPVEAFGYYCILYSPPFLFHTHVYSFIVYMIIMGICGVLDHSGIKLHLPLLYNTEDHDLHHSKFNVNYCFPFPWMDIIHNTYEGSYLGFHFTTSKKNK